MAQSKKRVYKLSTYFKLNGIPQQPYVTVLSDRSEICKEKLIHESTIRYITENQCTDIIQITKPIVLKGENKNGQRKKHPGHS